MKPEPSLGLHPRVLERTGAGQHKKMQLALAFALPVQLLLIDEPFNGLDAEALQYVRARLAARQGIVVLTSHLEPVVPVAQVVQL